MTEASIISRLVQALLEVADDGVSVNDGEETTLCRSRNAPAIIRALRTTDEDYLILYYQGQYAWVRLVYGNAPDEVINDHTTNLTPVIDPLMQDMGLV